ncbi:hypothetical protein MJH12_18640, partial [bacterium]|nr:hypothetical protein [bacterium]
MNRSSRYGDLVITEVQLDNEGIVAGIPYFGDINGIETIANKKTVKSDIVIELYNNSASPFDLNDLAILYLVETRESTLPVLDGVSTDLLYDICGLRDNTTDSPVSSYLTGLGWTITGSKNLAIKNFDGLATSSLAGAEVVAIYDQPLMADASIALNTADYLQRAGDNYTVTSGEVHSWPVTFSGSVPTYDILTFPSASHHRLFSGGLDGDNVALPGMAGGDDTGGGDPVINDYFGRSSLPRLSSDRLSPRLCLGNKWTNDVKYTTPLGGAVEDVDSWNFTIVLLDVSGGALAPTILDVFSIGRGASSQAYINDNNLISAADFNFTPAGIVIPNTGNATYCGGTNCEFDKISYLKTSYNPASSRSSYILTAVPTIGTVGDIVPPDPEDDGSADFLSGSAVNVQIKRPPISSTVLEPGFDGNEGDPESIFKIEFQATHNNAGSIQSVSFQLATTDVSPTFFPTGGPISLIFNGGTNKFEGEFVPLTLTNIATLKEFRIRIFATDNLGETDNEYVGSSVELTSVRSGPVINEFTATLNLPIKIGDIVPLSVDVADEGTAALKYIKVFLDSDDGSFTPVQETFTLPAFNDTPYVGKPPLLKPKYFHNFTVPSTVKTDGTTYFFTFDIADGFYSSDEKQRTIQSFSTQFFVVETAPRLDLNLIGGHPVNMVVDDSKTIDIRNAIRFDGTLGDTTIDIVLTAKSANITACGLNPAPEGATQLTITAGSAAGTGYCTFTLTTDTGKVGSGTIIINIIPSADTFLNSFQIAPSLTPSITPTGFTSQAKASWSDVLEFEANISDIDNVRSVQMNFVLTESGFESGGIPIPSGTTIYSVFLYDDFTDRRQPPNLPGGGAIPFGFKDLGGDNFYSYDTNLSDGNASGVHETKGQVFVGPSNGTLDRFPASTVGDRHLIAFEADLSASNDNLWHISIAPIKFQFPTHYRLDLVVEDDNLNVTNISGVGGVSVFTGPGYEPLTVINNVAFLGSEASIASNKVINLSGFECTAPLGVAGRKCGSELTTQEHGELTWSIVSFDTNFYSNVSITNSVQDEITYSLKAHACTSNGSGFVNLAVSDGVVSSTTDEYSLPITCVNDAPVYSPDYQSGGSRPVLSVPEESNPANLSILTFADEVIVGMAEDAQNTLIWTIQAGSGSFPNISSVNIVGTNLQITPVSNFSHPIGQFDTVVVCVEDSSGLVPSNGDVAKDGGGGTCITIPITIAPSDDNPTI